MTADVVIAGGGTGGHTSPGLAVAALLRERSIPCAWIGSRSGIEAQRVPLTGMPYVAISTGKLRRYWAWQNVGDLAVNVPMGTLGAVRALRALRPKVVFGTGGFVESARGMFFGNSAGHSQHQRKKERCGGEPQAHGEIVP